MSIDPTFYRTARRRDRRAAGDRSPTSPRSTRRAARRTPWPWWTATPRRRPTVRWSAGRDLPTAGNELHHFGWNACSSALCHEGHAGHLERRYLIVPGLRSSRTYILDTKPDPRAPRVVREIGAEELANKAGYSRPHTLHCGPDGIYMSALGGADGNDGPGGVALLDHDTFDVVGAWELDRGDAVLRLRHLVAPQPRHRDHLRVGDAVHDRERAQPRGPARPEVRSPPELLEHVRPQADPARRPRRPAPDGARGAPRPRSRQDLRLRRRGDQRRGPVRRRCGCGTRTATSGPSAR